MYRLRKLLTSVFLMLALALTVMAPASAGSTTNSPDKPTWWDKYQYLAKNGPMVCNAANVSLQVGANVDVSNECGPQSETYITLNPNQPKMLAAGSNEIFRLPMRGYFSADNGGSWGALDLPLPPSLSGTNDTDFGSDPTLAFDSNGSLYYGYIVVFFGGGGGVNGSEMAVARSTDGGKTYPQVTYFSFETGSNHFNDKPMITTDTNPNSPFRNNVYIAWDAASGGTIGGGIRVGASSDHGATFAITRADDPSGPGKSIGAQPFVGPNGELYVAWNDYHANAIVFNRSFDGGKTWGVAHNIASKSLAFDLGLPAEFSRGALVYPSCDTDRSSGLHRGRLICSWMDQTANGTTDIFAAYSDNQGATWSQPQTITDRLSTAVDRFYNWLSTDPVTGDVNVSFYDTRNDTTGARYMTDVYLARSPDGGLTWQPNARVTTVSSNEHDCSGTSPCAGINYGDQQGDYEGLVSYNGVSHPIWTDSRLQLSPLPGCRTGLAMEEVFTAVVK